MMAFGGEVDSLPNTVYNVRESEIIDVLSGYGILKYMLPTEMGGTLVVNQREWMANRWAIEIEEF